MTKRRIVFMLVLCFSMALLAVQALSQVPSSSGSARGSDAERRRKMADAERRRESAERRRQRELKNKELAKEGRGLLIDRETKRKKTAERRKEFTVQKWALGATPEQWTLIKAKLEEVRRLKEQAKSTIRVVLAGSIASETGRKTGAGTTAPLWQWKDPWKAKPPDEMTEAQRLGEQLVALLGRNSTTPEAFRLKMDALRKARTQEAELRRQLSEVQRDLREMLTPRQEAALVLMKWL